MSAAPSSTRDVLLRRHGLVFVEPQGAPVPAPLVRAVELELANLGHVPSARLSARLARLGVGPLAALAAELQRVLAAARGAHVRHEPLFRQFPAGVPADTEALWWQRVLVHYLQGSEQPCLTCRRPGTTHVLSPCAHVVCERCFDGSNYGACPICGRAVDRGSPFFRAAPVRVAGAERVRFSLLDLGDDLEAAARALVERLCARTQAMSPADVDDLQTLVREHGAPAIDWLPDRIPVKENVALVFGTLFRACAPAVVLSAARAHLRTATDVLRLIAVYSGASPALQGETRWDRVMNANGELPAWARVRRVLAARAAQAAPHRWMDVPRTIHRFRVARLGRPLRRALLALLEGFGADALAEDMLRHRSYWVWLGEHLHPGEYARRFPAVARAFALVRGRARDGTRAPRFAGFHAGVEAAAAAGDARAMLDRLTARPGELARRLDHALRIAGDDPAAVTAVTGAFIGAIGAITTPVLLTLASALPRRQAPAPLRVFWPKGGQATGVSAPDHRPPLRADAIAPLTRAITGELLRRLAARPGFAAAIVDEALADVPVPFNERTAARGAIQLPRGTRLRIPDGKVARLFLHWCQPEEGGRTTDLDLSVYFADDEWQPVGVCSYYQLRWEPRDVGTVAQSAGDRQDAPWPDGASELVDVDRARARAAGARYAVMVVNAYRGMAFAQLARGFAGLMLRDDVGGLHVDPRTVELAFELAGSHGIFAPLVLDLEAGTLHWLDVHARGDLALNNVESSKRDLSRMCPALIDYFASGVRPTMYDLALLHAAARTRRVWLRGDGGARAFVRGEHEDAGAWLARLRAGDGALAAPLAGALADGPVLAALLRGDLALPAGSAAYALFRERLRTPLAAADLLA